MENAKIDKESWFLLALIAFGLLVTLFIELLNLTHRPIILIIILGISTTALIYKLLGGFDNTSFLGHPAFKVTGSGAFLFGFIFILNPILERQTIPEKENVFTNPIQTWVPIDQNFQPIDLRLNFFDYNYSSIDFLELNPDRQLYFDVNETDFTIYSDLIKKTKLGI